MKVTSAQAVGSPQQQQRRVSANHRRIGVNDDREEMSLPSIKKAKGLAVKNNNKSAKPMLRKTLSEQAMITTSQRNLNVKKEEEDDDDIYKPVAKVEWGLNHYYHGDSSTWRVSSGKVPGVKPKETVNQGKGADWTNLPDVEPNTGNYDDSSSSSSSSDDDDDDNNNNNNDKKNNNDNQENKERGGRTNSKPPPAARKKMTPRRASLKDDEEASPKPTMKSYDAVAPAVAPAPSTPVVDPVPSSPAVAPAPLSASNPPTSKDEEADDASQPSLKPNRSPHMTRSRRKHRQTPLPKQSQAAAAVTAVLEEEVSEEVPEAQLTSNSDEGQTDQDSGEGGEAEPVAVEESAAAREERLKEELRQQMKEEVKMQMRLELEREALREQVRRELREELKDEVQKEVEMELQTLKQDKTTDDKLDQKQQQRSSRQRTSSSGTSSATFTDKSDGDHDDGDDEGSVSFEDVVRKTSPMARRSSSSGNASANLHTSASRFASNADADDHVPARARNSSRVTSDQHSVTSRASQGRSSSRRSSSNGNAGGAPERRTALARTSSRKNMALRRESGSTTRNLGGDEEGGKSRNSATIETMNSSHPELESSMSRLRRRASISNTPSEKEAEYHPTVEVKKSGDSTDLENEGDDGGMLAVLEKKKDLDKSSRTRRRNSLSDAQQQQLREEQQQQEQEQQQSPTPGGGHGAQSNSGVNAPESPGSPLRRFGKGMLFPFRGSNNNKADNNNNNDAPSSPRASDSLPELNDDDYDSDSVDSVIPPNTPGHDVFAYFIPKSELIIWIEIELSEEDKEKIKRKLGKDKKKMGKASSGDTVNGEEIIQYPELNIHLAAREVSNSNSRQSAPRQDEPYRPVGPLRDSTTDTLVQAF
ncbi:hypothetical protein ACA910_000331 [Epithemia clementina (nom. ined.)]